MDYQVPQFIDVEDKIFGPFTLKQFIYVAGGAGICVAAFLYLPFFFAFLVAAPVAGLAGALAFFKLNGKPFIDVLESGFNYYIGSRLYLWRKDQDAVSETKAAPAPIVTARPKVGLTEGKLHDLAWSLDVKDQQN